MFTGDSSENLIKDENRRFLSRDSTKIREKRERESEKIIPVPLFILFRLGGSKRFSWETRIKKNKILTFQSQLREKERGQGQSECKPGVYL